MIKTTQLGGHSKKILIEVIVILSLILLSLSSVSAVLSDGLVSYWSMDGANDAKGINNFTTVGSVSNTTGKIGNATLFDGASGYYNLSNSTAVGIPANDENRTMCLWVYSDSGADTDNGIGGIGSVSATKNTFQFAQLQSQNNVSSVMFGNDSVYGTLQPNGWNFLCMVYSSNGVLQQWKNDTAINRTVGTLITSKAVVMGRYVHTTDILKGRIDEVGIWNRTLSGAEIITLYNSGAGLSYSDIIKNIEVSLNTPINNQQSANSTITFKGIYTPSSLETGNATLYLWNNSGSLITTSINTTSNNQSIHTIKNINPGSYYWNILINDSTNNNNYTKFAITNNTLNITIVVINSNNYNLTTQQTSTETIQTNITIHGAYNINSVNLYYNNNIFSGTITTIGDNYLLTSTPTIPSSSLGISNLTWQLRLNNTIYYNLTTFTQTVTGIIFSYCNTTVNTTSLNITIYDIDTEQKLNASLLVNFNYRRGVSENINYSFTNTTTNNTYTFCVNPASLSLITDATIQFGASGYSTNYHYLSQANITNQTQELSLYLINSSRSTLTTFITQDIYTNKLSDVLIYIQKYNPGTDTYTTVSMMKTNSEGYDISYLNWYDTFYKMILIRPNGAVQQEQITKISATPKTYTLRDSSTFVYDEFKNVNYNLSYNANTGNIVLTYVDPSGLISNGCLRIIKRTYNTETIVSDVCVASTSGTLYYDINSSGDGTYSATFYATGSPPYPFETIVQTITNLRTLISSKIPLSDQNFYAFIIAATISFIGIASAPAMIIASLIGIVVAASLGFTTSNMLMMGGIIIAGIIIAMTLKNR